MFVVKKTFEELLDEFIRKDLDQLVEIAPVLQLFAMKASFCMESFYPIMDVIIEVELKFKMNYGVECYTISPDYFGGIVWIGYQSTEVIHQEKNPAPDLTRPWEVVIIKNNEGEKEVCPLIYFNMDGVMFNVSTIYMEMRGTNSSFNDLINVMIGGQTE